jgi:hypothetical protein
MIMEALLRDCLAPHHLGDSLQIKLSNVARRRD